MSNSKLRLDDCTIRSLQIQTRARIRQEAVGASEHIPGNLVIRFSVMKNEAHPLQHLIPMSITVSWDDDASTSFEKIAIELNGIFSLPEGTTEEEVQQYIPLLCLANLYGIARGIVAQATGTFPEGAFFLPLINMVDVVNSAQDDTQSDQGTPPAEPEPEPKRSRRRKASETIE